MLKTKHMLVHRFETDVLMERQGKRIFHALYHTYQAHCTTLYHTMPRHSPVNNLIWMLGKSNYALSKYFEKGNSLRCSLLAALTFKCWYCNRKNISFRYFNVHSLNYVIQLLDSCFTICFKTTAPMTEKSIRSHLASWERANWLWRPIGLMSTDKYCVEWKSCKEHHRYSNSWNFINLF